MTRDRLPLRTLAADAGGARSGHPPGAAEFQVPKGYHHTDDDDELHVLVTDEIKSKAYKMFREARENPKSGAGEMVRILLLNAVANMHADRYADPKTVLAEERHRGDEARLRNEMAQHQISRLTTQRKRDEQAIELNRLKAAELQQKISERDRKLAEALEAAENARRSLENGQPIDAMAVYNKIAEIVGLRAPGEQEQAAGGAEPPGEQGA